MNTYTKYFTPERIVHLLLSMIDFDNINNCIDLCCGTGNFLLGTKRYKSNLDLFGVDIYNHKIVEFDFVNDDGRHYASRTEKKYDLIVANPPFGRLSKEDSFLPIYDIKHRHLARKRIEIEMLFSNLKILNNSGTMVIIMPVTFVIGDYYRSIRDFLENNYLVESIVDLPDNTFGLKKIKCYALIIKNQKHDNGTKLYTIDENFITIKQVGTLFLNNTKGYWLISKPKNKYKLSISRGKQSSKYIHNYGDTAILHTSKNSDVWNPKMKYIDSKNINNQKTFVEDGDVIISRVGDSCGKCCLYSGEKVLISDCLLVIKNANEYLIDKILEIDFSKYTQGLSTKHITVSSVLNIIDNL
jgi:type I restriction enzyme M protein